MTLRGGTTAAMKWPFSHPCLFVTPSSFGHVLTQGGGLARFWHLDFLAFGVVKFSFVIMSGVFHVAVDADQD